MKKEKRANNKSGHLPLYGAGPLYVIIIFLLTAVFIIFYCFGFFDSGKISALEIPFKIFGTLMIVFGTFLWLSAVIGAKIDKNIIENRLVTTGIYRFVRNPIYSAFLFACTGACLWTSDLWLLILPFVFWLFLTVLMKNTEEKWLYKLYGNEYSEYCRKVNRCIPWFPKK